MWACQRFNDTFQSAAVAAIAAASTYVYYPGDRKPYPGTMESCVCSSKRTEAWQMGSHLEPDFDIRHINLHSTSFSRFLYPFFPNSQLIFMSSRRPGHLCGPLCSCGDIRRQGGAIASVWHKITLLSPSHNICTILAMVLQKSTQQKGLGLEYGQELRKKIFVFVQI